MINVLPIAAMAFLTSGSLPLAAPVKWAFAAHELPNGQVRIDITATIDKDWHVYATELPSDEGPLPTAFTFTPSDKFSTVGGVVEPDPEKADDPNFGMVLHYHSNTVIFSQVVARKYSGTFKVDGAVEYMACNGQMCLPPLTVPFIVEVPALKK